MVSTGCFLNMTGRVYANNYGKNLLVKPASLLFFKNMYKILLMKYKNEINDVQGLILRQLFTRDSLRFSEINTEGYSSDHFSYHLRQLIKHGLIERTDDDRYRLSVIGRSRGVLLSTQSSGFIEQGFIACRIVISRETDGIKQYLIQERTKVPYKDYLAEPGGKILYGENIIDAARRNLLAETGLDCDLEVKGIVHYKDEYQKIIVQDKYFFVIKGSKPTGDINPHGPTGKNCWMSLDNLSKNSKAHQGLTELIEIAEGSSPNIQESTHVVYEY